MSHQGYLAKWLSCQFCQSLSIYDMSHLTIFLSVFQEYI